MLSLLAMEDTNAVPTVEEGKSRDLSPALIAKESRPKATWFVRRRGDGFEFPVEEAEAWELLYNRSTWKRQDFEFIGYSDGTTYHRIVSEGMKRAKVLEPQIEAKKKEIDRYLAQEDRFIMNEVVDMEGDPTDTENEANKQKVLRMQKIRNRLEDQLEELEREYRSVTKGVVERATNEEKKVAVENWAVKKTWPNPNAHIVTPEASGPQRDRLLAMMGGR